MSTFEDRLRLLQVAPASEGLRKRLEYSSILNKKRPNYSRLVPVMAAAAGLLFVLYTAIMTHPPVLTPGQETAEEAFRKIQETLDNSQTLRVTFSRVGTLRGPKGDLEKVETSGHLYLKEGNRLSMDFTERRAADDPNSPSASFLIVSNGTRLQRWLVNKGRLKSVVPEADTPMTLNARFTLALGRKSIAVPNAILPYEVEDLKTKHFPVSGLMAGPDDGVWKTMTYQVGPWEAKIWYAPKNHLVSKRTLDSKSAGSLTENYEEVVTGARVDDELFVLRSEK